MSLSGLGVPILVALSFALSVIGLYVFIVALSSQSPVGPRRGGECHLFRRVKRTLPKRPASEPRRGCRVTGGDAGARGAG